MGDFSVLTSCPVCGSNVILRFDEWIGNIATKGRQKKIKELARQNCEKCKQEAENEQGNYGKGS